MQLEKKASGIYDLFYSGLCSLRDGRIAVIEYHNKKRVILNSSLQPLGQSYIRISDSFKHLYTYILLFNAFLLKFKLFCTHHSSLTPHNITVALRALQFAKINIHLMPIKTQLCIGHCQYERFTCYWKLKVKNICQAHQIVRLFKYRKLPFVI